MNPVLAGLGMLVISRALSAVPWARNRPLSRHPSDKELGNQFIARMSDLEQWAMIDFLGWDSNEWLDALLNANLLEADGIDWSDDDKIDAAFRAAGGCRKGLRRSVRDLEPLIDEVRAVTRHPSFSLNRVYKAFVDDCELATRMSRQHCRDRWREAEDMWNEILGNYIDYRKLERRVCPALISGVGRKQRRLR